jgi:hypothetical protein
MATLGGVVTTLVGIVIVVEIVALVGVVIVVRVQVGLRIGAGIPAVISCLLPSRRLVDGVVARWLVEGVVRVGRTVPTHSSALGLSVDPSLTRRRS